MPKALKLVGNEGEDLYRFQCVAMKLPTPREQYFFAAEMNRKFRADFAFPPFKLLVEIQGGIWRRGGGAHSRPSRIEDDVERMQYAALLGWTILPFTPDQVHSGHAIDWTQRVLAARGLGGT